MLNVSRRGEAKGFAAAVVAVVPFSSASGLLDSRQLFHYDTRPDTLLGPSAPRYIRGGMAECGCACRCPLVQFNTASSLRRKQIISHVFS